MGRIKLAPGTLRTRLEHRTAEALRSGALQPIATRYELVDDAGVSFLVRVVSSLSISVNALGFAGALLVHDQAALARLQAAGPMRVLASVAWPR